MFARVAMNLPVDKLFDYRIPPSLQDAVVPGRRVYVPFGPRKMVGYCTEVTDRSDVPPSKVKDIVRTLDDQPLLDANMLKLTQWTAVRYACSWGEVLEAALPAGVRHSVKEKTVRTYGLAVSAQEAAQATRSAPAQAKIVSFLASSNEQHTAAELQRLVPCSSGPIRSLVDKGILKVAEEESNTGVPKIPPHKLTGEQQQALDNLTGRIDSGSFSTALLHGITGSGKTEIYLYAIERIIAKEKQAIVLVPEISLTPQTVERFRGRFDHVAVLHSRLTAGERYGQWLRIRNGEADVIIGARSAIFAPCPRLGLIVIDEEHENSFKQDSVPRYHAREVALKRGEIEKAVIVLGSATPSLESFYVSRQRLVLSQRVGGGKLPPAEIVDMYEEQAIVKRPVLFSRRFVALVNTALAAGDQTMIFLNRRGFSTYIRCPRCGFVLRCGHCDISLTYHRKDATALCHYCGESVEPPDACPECAFTGIRYSGVGTEKVAATAQKIWPEAVVRRMDSDSMRRRTAMAETLAEFREGKTDILVGTQMIAKGHDFPNVTVVGVVDADTALNFPDFRAAERTFQLICQVAGRAGRSAKGGHVVIQTRNPDHYAIRYASKYDFEGFAAEELAARRRLGYPPFGKLARVLCTGMDNTKTADVARQVADLAGKCGGVQVLGPAPAPIERIKDRWRWHILIKAPEAEAVEAAVKILAEIKPRGTRVMIDVDPMSLL